jgi:hypothetical protein
VRLERPFIFCFDHPRGGFERLIDVAVRLAFFTLAHRRVADVIEQRLLVDERRLAIRPLHLEFFRRADGIPFLVCEHG